MQRMRQMSEREVNQVARVVMGISLLILVSGVWVCLWVPPSF